METTINMPKGLYDQLCQLSLKSGLSRRHIIDLVLERAIEQEPFLEKSGVAVKYQEDALEWHKFHILFNPDEYERNLLLRSLFKLSFSLIVSCALELYAELVISKKNESEKKIEDIDIYRPITYAFYSERSENEHVVLFFTEKRRE